MNVQQFFFERHSALHSGVTEQLVDGLTDEQFRARPHDLNPIAWLIWHAARCEDLGVNRMAANRRQVLDDGWIGEMRVIHRHQGTGMTLDEAGLGPHALWVDQLNDDGRPRTKGWVLGHLALTHSFWHLAEASVTKRFLGFTGR